MELKISDLPPQFESIASKIGIEKTTVLFEEFGGGMVYFPSKKMIYREARNREIVARFNGANINDLSNMYNLSNIHIRAIIRESMKRK
ncbi:MAG: Mor transcription activator family protein [Peptostreptococcaceae bacterium]